MAFNVIKSFLNGWRHKDTADNKIDLASEDSFPASDAPSWNKTTASSDIR